MRKYIVIITSLFMLLLATGLYGESDDQPKWNTTLFGSYFLGFGRGTFGIGGTVGYHFTPRQELEGEVNTILPEARGYIVSEGVLYNFHTDHNKAVPYVVGGLGQIIGGGEIGFYFMFGAGLKMPLTRSFKIRLDFRLYMGEGFPSRLSTGLMWSF